MKTPDMAVSRALVAGLAPEEQAVLPSRLRALVADHETVAWNVAKAERDAALEAAYEVEDLDERAVAITAAKDAWTARKAQLLVEG